jgi:tetratricopeptide (TPR) repeat protein
LRGQVYYLQQAEELARQNKIDEAINAYRLHMHARLTLTDRPEWENPYLYLLLIGDLYLAKADINKAQESYLSAELNKVDAHLISDRFRALASWHEKQGDLEAAIAILTKNRERDPLLFDAMLDRISKDLVKREQAISGVERDRQ